MLESFAAWLGATPFSAFVAGQAWVVPSVQTVHILSVAVVMGAVAIINLRTLGVLERGQTFAGLATRFVAPTLIAIVVLAATGFVLIAAEPTRAIFRYVFWAKLGLLLLALVLSGLLLRGLKTRPVWSDAALPTPALYRLLALVNLATWLAVIVAGRWIGYAQGWPGSPA